MTDHHHDHSHHGHDHSHDHSHDSSGNENVSWTEKNRAHWNAKAATYNSRETQQAMGDLINKISAFMLLNINWIGVPFVNPSTGFETSPAISSNESVRVLDYACGPGTVTAALAGYATEYVGIDVSENMVEEYKKRFSSSPLDTNTGSSQSETINAKAVVGDLLDPKGTPSALDDEKYFNFDLAVVSGGFHHFEHVDLATQRLVDRLRPGGVLMIFDFLTHAHNDMTGDPALQTVMHHGFTEERIHELFGGAGLVDIEIKQMTEKVTLRGKAERQGFLAKGRKPTS